MPKRRRRTRGGSKAKLSEAEANSSIESVETVVSVKPDNVVAVIEGETVDAVTIEKPKKIRKPRKTKAEKEAQEASAIAAAPGTEVLVNEGKITAVNVPDAKVKAKRVRKSIVKKLIVAPGETDQVSDGVKATSVVEVTEKDTPKITPAQESVPKKRGWWSRG